MQRLVARNNVAKVQGKGCEYKGKQIADSRQSGTWSYEVLNMTAYLG